MMKIILFGLGVLCLASGLFILNSFIKKPSAIFTRAIPSQAISPSSTPTPEPPFTHYQMPKLSNKKVYNIVLVGDSMTHALGPHGGRLLDYLQAKFVGKGFIIDNYAYSTNITSLPNFLTQTTKTWDVTFPPILERSYDVIIIESFGYNPLSNYSIPVGLEHQEEVVNQSIKQLLKAHPSSLIVFMATIAPNKEMYAKGTVQMTEDQRQNEVNERIAYINNFIKYANNHNIPLINVFEKSQDNGDGILKYINPDDYIHPSIDGIELISDTITNTLWNQNLIPH